MSCILLVDPNPETRSCTCRQLLEAGWSVRSYAFGHEALESVLASPPDVVIQDFPLPDMDGLEFLSLVSAAEPRIPVILYTENAGLRDNFRTWLAEAYILRGQDTAPLVRAIRRVLRTRAKVASHVTSLVQTHSL